MFFSEILAADLQSGRWKTCDRADATNPPATGPESAGARSGLKYQLFRERGQAWGGLGSGRRLALSGEVSNVRPRFDPRNLGWLFWRSSPRFVALNEPVNKALRGMERSFSKLRNHRWDIYKTFLGSQVEHSKSAHASNAQLIGNRQCCSIIDQGSIGADLHCQSDRFQFTRPKVVEKQGRPRRTNLQPSRRSGRPSAHPLRSLDVPHFEEHGRRRKHRSEYNRKNVLGANEDQVIQRRRVAYDDHFRFALRSEPT